MRRAGAPALPSSAPSRSAIAITSARAIVLGPSNPVISIGPILAEHGATVDRETGIVRAVAPTNAAVFAARADGGATGSEQE